MAYPHLAANPVKGIIAVLGSLYDTPLDDGSAHFSPSNLEVTSIDVNNPATNVIPASAEARLNIRFNDLHGADALKAMLQDLVASTLSGTDLTFDLAFSPPGDAFVTKPGELDALVSEAVHETTGKTPSLSTNGGTSDARFIKDYCPVVEFGLTTQSIHKTDENVKIADLGQLTAIYRHFIARYFETFGGPDGR